MKGETVDEIAGMVRVMREKALQVEVSGDVLDVVSTGGGAFDPFNISTAAALVCAGAGVRVAKHGNRGFTSASGAADVLEALGAKIELTPEQSKVCIEKTGFGFLFAPALHPAMRFVGPTRREIGIRTIFNSLGPLTNPAGAQYQLLGVGDGEMAAKVAAVLARLGVGTGAGRAQRRWPGRGVAGRADDGPRADGGKALRTYTLTPEESRLRAHPAVGGEERDARQRTPSACARCSPAQGRPDRDYTLINAGAALVAAERATSVREGVALAREAIDSGAAARALRRYVVATQSFRRAKDDAIAA